MRYQIDKQLHLQLMMIQDFVLQLSHRDFRNFYIWSLIICEFLTLYTCMTEPVLACAKDKLFYCGGYVLGVLISYFALWDFVKIHFRNLAGIAAAAVIYPLLVLKLFLKTIVENSTADTVVLLVVCLMIPLCYGIITKGSMILWPVIKYCGFSTLLRMPLYNWKRDQMLKQQERSDGLYDNSKRMDKYTWRKTGKEERVQYIQQIAEKEKILLGLPESFQCISLDEAAEVCFTYQFQIIWEQQCMVWKEKTVMQMPLERIVQYLVITLQEYQWYQSMAQETKLRISSEEDEEYLLYQQMKELESVEAYDLITWHYAEYKGDWYSGL